MPRPHPRSLLACSSPGSNQLITTNTRAPVSNVIARLIVSSVAVVVSRPLTSPLKDVRLSRLHRFSPAETLCRCTTSAPRVCKIICHCIIRLLHYQRFAMAQTYLLHSVEHLKDGVLSVLREAREIWEVLSPLPNPRFTRCRVRYCFVTTLCARSQQAAEVMSTQR